MKSLCPSSLRSLGCCLSLACAGLANAYVESFDSYTTNSTIIGQGGWRGWDNNSSLNATVVNTRSVSVPNALRSTDATNVVRPFTGFTSGKWVIRALQYVPSNSVGETHFVLFNRYVANDHPSADWSVELVADAGANTMRNVQNGDVTALVEDVWAEIRCEIDLDLNRVKVYYNGGLLTDSAWTTGGVLAIGAVQLLAFDPTSFAFYDDISLNPPATSEVLAPVSEQFVRGQAVGGSLASWAADDGNARVVRKFVVLNQSEAFARATLNFVTTKTAPTGIRIESKARMVDGGVFRLSLGLKNKDTGLFDTVLAETALGTSYGLFSGNASGVLTRYIDTGGAVAGQIAVRQAGPSTALLPQASFETGLLTVTG